MQQFVYPAVFLKGADSYRVLFPDLDLTTEGETMSHAYLYAKELLRVYFTYAVKFGLDYNLPSKYEDILQKCGNNQLALLIDTFILDSEDEISVKESEQEDVEDEDEEDEEEDEEE